VLRRRRRQTLERHRSGPDPAPHLVGVAHRPVAQDHPGRDRADPRQFPHREDSGRDQRLHAIGVKHVQRSVDLPAERIEAGRYGLGPELQSGACRSGP